jgi:hydroxymethylpyrimidine pyrophosphatase-like HAD family hydrolase
LMARLSKRAQRAQVVALPEHAHWLDRGTEHPHRCSLSVHTAALDTVRAAVREGCALKRVAVRIIVSGVGDWRYVDCVAAGAGKLEALEHVRRKEGVSVERCVACGDSGNDKLMLAGRNPAIVVGNAQPDLVDWVMRQPQSGRVVLADQVGAKGILEGLMSLALW